MTGTSTAAGDAAPQRLSADEVAALLDLAPLPDEGGRFRRTYGDAASSAILYLIGDGDFSALHRLSAPEVYHFHAGDPALLTVIDPAGRVERVLLGADLAAGCRPQAVVPAGCWQGSRSTGSWSLLGTTMAPGWTPEMFELADRAALTAAHPHAAAVIAELTR